MQLKSDKHVRAARTRKANVCDAFVPDRPFQLPGDASSDPHMRPGLYAHGTISLELMAALKWYHSVSELRDCLRLKIRPCVPERIIRFWLKAAVNMDLVNVYVQPLSIGHRLIFILEGQSVDDKYMPYITLEEANRRYVEAHGEGHEEKGWW